MGACANCRSRAVPQPAPAPLFQIRRGYRARWNSLGFLLNADADRWTLVVEDADSCKTLHTAQRAGARAAQVAAAEFGIFWALGPESCMSPERLAQELNWQETW